MAKYDYQIYYDNFRSEFLDCENRLDLDAMGNVRLASLITRTKGILSTWRTYCLSKKLSTTKQKRQNKKTKTILYWNIKDQTMVCKNYYPFATISADPDCNNCKFGNELHCTLRDKLAKRK